jgi:uncharacterized protein (DUF433 family)
MPKRGPGGVESSGPEELAMKLAERIEANPEVMLGKPVIRGTRAPVELILRRISEGAIEEDLLASYPHLTRDDIRAVRPPDRRLISPHN